jgi:glutathione S-transferase
LDISPLSKVPVLRIGDDTLFESAVINEYLDDIYPPSMHPEDPLDRAINKAWIEFSSEMLFSQYRYYTAKTEDDFYQNRDDLTKKIKQLNEKLGEGPFFNGDKFSLIDAAYTPLFTRLSLLESLVDNNIYKNAPKVAHWAENLIVRETVKNSVIPEFQEKYLTHIARAEGYAGDLFRQAKQNKSEIPTRVD